MYFEKPGKQNTQETVNIALQAAKELGIDTIVVATNTGDTADLLKDAARSGLHVVAVSHCFGFKDPEVQEMPAERKAALEAAGIQVYTATHVLSGAERGLSAKFGGISPIEVMAYSLRMLGQGTKVAVECSVMALDGGMIPYQKPSSPSAEPAAAQTPLWCCGPPHAANILDTKIDRVLCKPVLL